MKGHKKSDNSDKKSIINLISAIDKRKAINIVEFILIIIMVISVIKIVFWFKDNKTSETIIEDISEKITIDESAITEEEKEKGIVKYNVDFDGLKKINNDTVAYVRIENTDIQYPVVKAKDNDYYLNHSFDKSYNSAGWIFMDYRNKADGTDKNIIIYGHNRRDGSMFGSLNKILQQEWYNNEQNKFITIVTPQENIIYEVFSIYKIQDENYYIKTQFENEEEYMTFLKDMQARSIKAFGNELNSNDKILTISTCDNNNKYRVVLQARRFE